MAKLTESVKQYIVQELACWATPSEVAESVKEEFGLKVTRQQVHTYNPNSVHGKQLAEKWKVLFEETRAAFLKETSKIPAANKAFRLRQLSEAAQRAKARGNFPLMAQLLEQAAKECGNYFTNKHHVEATGKGGQSLFQVVLDPRAVRESQEQGTE